MSPYGLRRPASINKSQVTSMAELAQKPDRLPPPLEMQAMKVLWSRGSATVGEVRDDLEPTKPLAYTTVLTLLDRLAHKGAVTRRKRGRSYVYSPALSRETALDLALDRLLDEFFANDREELIGYLERGGVLSRHVAHEESLDAALL